MSLLAKVPTAASACVGKHTRALLSTGDWGRHSSRQGYRDLYRIWQKLFWSVKGLNAHTTKFSFKFSAASPAMS